MEYVLEMKDISKTFPGVKALDHVQLQVKPGEVHALMGENGAGKSTLMKILMGIYTKDNGGEIIFNGQPYHVSNPKEAMDHGVAMIHQELNPILDMSVYENIFVGREIRKNGLVDAKAEIAEAEKLIKECGLHVSPKEKLRNLTVAQCQLIEIIKAISINAKVIVMDEPTAAITDREVELLFEHIRSLTAKGVAIIYISHRMDEIFSICDRVSVYRDGQYIGSGDTKDLDEAQLIKMMVGREITDVFPKLEAEIGDVVFEAKNIVRADNKVKGVSLSVRRGEILGIGGMAGQGKLGIANGIMGLHPAGGSVSFEGRAIELNNPESPLAAGISAVSEDRRGVGLLLEESIAWNIIFTSLQMQGRFLRQFGPVKIRDEEGIAECARKYIRDLEIKCTSERQHVQELSGGNQQKVCLAKAFETRPKLLFVAEPTRGIDVGAKRVVLDTLKRYNREHGMTIVVISSELEELRSVCDRIAIIDKGAVAGILPAATPSEAFGYLLMGAGAAEAEKAAADNSNGMEAANA